MQSRDDLLESLLGWKADVWGFNTEDYKYWSDYFATLTLQDLLDEYYDYFGE